MFKCFNPVILEIFLRKEFKIGRRGGISCTKKLVIVNNYEKIKCKKIDKIIYQMYLFKSVLIQSIILLC